VDPAAASLEVEKASLREVERIRRRHARRAACVRALDTGRAVSIKGQYSARVARIANGHFQPRWELETHGLGSRGWIVGGGIYFSLEM